MPIGVSSFQILTPEQANPFGYGLAQGIQARLQAAQAKAQEEKNPFIAPQAQADVQSTLLKNIYQKLVNQYTPEDYRTEFAQRGAQTANLGSSTALNNLKLKYPGLGESGIMGQIAYANLLSDHPEIGRRIQGALADQQSGQSALTAPQAMQAPQGQPPGAAPMASAQVGAPQGGMMEQPSGPIAQQQGAPQAAQGSQAQQAMTPPTLGQNINAALPAPVPPQSQIFNPLNAMVRDINADITGKEALANYRGMGGRGGVVAQNQLMLQKQILKDNPSLTEEQAFDAAGNLVQGNQTLSDGTPFKVSGLTQLTAAKAVMQGTTSALATQGVRSAQAEAEIPIVDKYIQQGRTPYGDTFMGYSAQQIADVNHPRDKAAQERLGKYGASELLSLEKAALGLKMAGIESGQTIMDEAMTKANQTIKKATYLQTDRARQVALDTYRAALKEMLAARKQVGVLQGGLTGNLKKSDVQVGKYDHLSNEDLQRIANGS